MWTKIVSEADVKKMKMNSRLLRFTGTGIPKDPPLVDPTYTAYVLEKNMGDGLNLKSVGHNPFFNSFSAAGTDVLHKPASELIKEGIWWY